MLMHINLVRGVDITLLESSLMASWSAVGVLQLPRVIIWVAPNGNTSAIGILLMLVVVADKAAIGYVAHSILWNLIFVDKKIKLFQL
jgi:hypothetical protein